MKNTEKKRFSRNVRMDILSIVLVFSMIGLSLLSIFSVTHADDILPDTTPPVITISSPADGSTVSGFPTLSGTVTDTGWIESVFVNGFAATLGSWIWSKIVYDLAGGMNTVIATATDTARNTGSTSIQLNRVSFPYNTNVALLGTTSAKITFFTDLSATGIVRYGTGWVEVSLLDQSVTGSTLDTQHIFTLTGLMPDTIYYFLVQGQGGDPSPVMNFKTPTTLDISNTSWSVVAISSMYLSGSTSSGATFSGNGSLEISSLTSSNSSLSVPLTGLTVLASWNDWDGVLQAPEVTSDGVNLPLSGYAFIGTFYQVGNAKTELIFSGPSPTVTVHLGNDLGGQIIRIFRSSDYGATYTEIPSCTITGGGDCIFTTDTLARFAFARPADVIPDAFSFSGVTDARLSAQYVSAPVHISGISGQTALSVNGGEYSINNAPFTALDGVIHPSDTIVLRVKSSSSTFTSTSAMLTIWWVSGTFTVTTGSGEWGKWVILLKDVCSDGDLSPSYYDRTCKAIENDIQSDTATDSDTAMDSNINTGTSIDDTMNSYLFTGLDSSTTLVTSLADIHFTDIRGNWAELFITNLASRGIVDNTEFYHPNNNLTRAEFLKIVINATGWRVPTEGLDIPFTDISLSNWYTPYISLALSKGMISRGNTNFRPNDAISRAEAVKILMAASGIQIDEPSTITFADLDLKSDLTKYIEAAKSMNILAGQQVNGQLRFRPNDSITRAEIAKVIVYAFHL